MSSRTGPSSGGPATRSLSDRVDRFDRRFVGLLAGRALRTVLALFWLQMLGTFLVLVIQPDVAFQRGNPLLLTVEGEFVVKNLVLLSAGMVVGSTVRRRRRPWLGPV